MFRALSRSDGFVTSSKLRMHMFLSFTDGIGWFIIFLSFLCDRLEGSYTPVRRRQFYEHLKWSNVYSVGRCGGGGYLSEKKIVSEPFLLRWALQLVKSTPFFWMLFTGEIVSPENAEFSVTRPLQKLSWVFGILFKYCLEIKRSWNY